MLRLAGVPGVGKSTVAWAVARTSAATGAPVGYLDIDQLGMCYPAPVDDPDRWALKETALVRLIARLDEAGIERLVVSGVADPAEPSPGNGHPTVSLWLRASEVTRRTRLAPRRWAQEQVDDVLGIGTRETEAAHPAWSMLETDGCTVEATERAVLDRWAAVLDGGATGMAAPAPAMEAPAQDLAPPTSHATERVIWVTGPRCAGSSRVGWEIASGLWREQRRTGFIDVAQLAFAWNVDRKVGLQNTSTLQRTFAAIGAQTLVAVAPLEIGPDDVRAAFPGADVRFLRLDADETARRERARRRAAGDGASLAGDDLVGASSSVIEDVVMQGSRQRRWPLREGELLIDTSGATLVDVTARVTALLPD